MLNSFHKYQYYLLFYLHLIKWRCESGFNFATVSLPVHNARKVSGAQPASDQKSSLCRIFCPEEEGQRVPAKCWQPSTTFHNAPCQKIQNFDERSLQNLKSHNKTSVKIKEILIENRTRSPRNTNVGVLTSVACRSGVQGTTHISKQHALQQQPDTATSSTCPPSRELLPPY